MNEVLWFSQVRADRYIIIIIIISCGPPPSAHLFSAPYFFISSAIPGRHY